MRNKSRNCLRLIAPAVMLMAMAMICMPAAMAETDNPNPQVIPPGAHPFGKAYSEWTAEWWKWHLALAASDHPAFSLDGANCHAGQSGKVWFLAGAFTTEFPENEFSTIIRELCIVPTSKAIFFPIINVGCSTIEAEPFRLIEDSGYSNAETCASNFVDGTIAIVDDLSVTIDGKVLNITDAYRSPSPVFEFEFNDPDDNILGVGCGLEDCDNARAASDGYWVMLPPLSAGEHTVQFTGSFRDPVTHDLFFGLDVTYEITVENRR